MCPYENIGFTVVDVIPIFLCVLVWWLTVFIVLEWHVKNEVCVVWCWLELCCWFSSEVVCECSDDFVLDNMCVAFLLYVW